MRLIYYFNNFKIEKKEYRHFNIICELCKWEREFKSYEYDSPDCVLRDIYIKHFAEAHNAIKIEIDIFLETDF